MIDGMTFSRLSPPTGLRRILMAPWPFAAMYVMPMAGAWTTPMIGHAWQCSSNSNSEMVTVHSAMLRMKLMAPSILPTHQYLSPGWLSSGRSSQKPWNGSISDSRARV